MLFFALSFLPLFFRHSIVIYAGLLSFPLIATCFAVRAFRINRFDLFVLLMNLLTVFYLFLYVILSKHPLPSATPLIIYFPNTLLFLATAKLALLGISVEEWLFVLQRLPLLNRPLVTIALTLSTAFASGAVTLTSAWRNRALSLPRMWMELPDEKAFLVSETTRAHLTNLKDKAEEGLGIFARMSVFLVALLRNLRDCNTKEASVAATDTALGISSLYSSDMFRQFYLNTVDTHPISPEWAALLERRLMSGMTIADVGAGTGRLMVLLSRLCKHVDAIEPNPQFYAMLQARLNAQRDSSVTLINGRFPCQSVSHRYDAIILHQNTILELIDELGLDVLWSQLFVSLNTPGIVIFDYPASILSLDTETVMRICEKLELNGRLYDYHYRYLGEAQGFQLLRGVFRCHDQDGVRFTHEFTLRLRAHASTIILQSANNKGFTTLEKVPTSMNTLYPGGSEIYVLGRA